MSSWAGGCGAVAPRSPAGDLPRNGLRRSTRGCPWASPRTHGLARAAGGPGGDAHYEGDGEEQDGQSREHVFVVYRTPVRVVKACLNRPFAGRQRVTSSGMSRVPWTSGRSSSGSERSAARSASRGSGPRGAGTARPAGRACARRRRLSQSSNRAAEPRLAAFARAGSWTIPIRTPPPRRPAASGAPP